MPSRHIYKNDSEFIKKHADTMFGMYIQSYSAAKQVLWFTTASEMLKYPCNLIVTTEDDKIIAFIMFQRRVYANKISLGVHNGTLDGKEEAIRLRVEALNKRGWVLEASGASSWIMRKKHVPIIKSQNLIKKLLEITPPFEDISMNVNFDPTDKHSYQYMHRFMKADGVTLEFENKETLFGVGGCRFDTDTCQRKCETALVD